MVIHLKLVIAACSYVPSSVLPINSAARRTSKFVCFGFSSQKIRCSSRFTVTAYTICSSSSPRTWGRMRARMRGWGWLEARLGQAARVLAGHCSVPGFDAAEPFKSTSACGRLTIPHKHLSVEHDTLRYFFISIYLLWATRNLTSYHILQPCSFRKCLE
jgi:hypothetical protein